MPEKAKSSTPKTLQRQLVGEVIKWVELLVFVASLGSMMIFWSSSRPILDRIQTYYHFSLPTNVENIHFYTPLWELSSTITSFTVSAKDVDQILNSFNPGSDGVCLAEYLESNYMPEFSKNARFEWWIPHEARIYDGAECYGVYESGNELHNLMLIDYSVEGKATFYFEEYRVEDGQQVWSD